MSLKMIKIDGSKIRTADQWFLGYLHSWTMLLQHLHIDIISTNNPSLSVTYHFQVTFLRFLGLFWIASFQTICVSFKSESDSGNIQVQIYSKFVLFPVKLYMGQLMPCLYESGQDVRSMFKMVKVWGGGEYMIREFSLLRFEFYSA